MTNSIFPVSPTPVPAENDAASVNNAAGKAAPPSAAKPNDAAVPSEAVTLSAAAQTTTQLLSAAQASSGVDAAVVQNIRDALQNGSYNVAPEDLAQAIATVLKESS